MDMLTHEHEYAHNVWRDENNLVQRKDFENNLNNYIAITFRNKYWLWTFAYTKNDITICLKCMMVIALKHIVSSQK